MPFRARRRSCHHRRRPRVGKGRVWKIIATRRCFSVVTSSEIYLLRLIFPSPRFSAGCSQSQEIRRRGLAISESAHKFGTEGIDLLSAHADLLNLSFEVGKHIRQRREFGLGQFLPR